MARAWPALGLLLVFGVSRAIFYWAGVRFDAGPLALHWQYIDPELLRHDLLRSLYYLHSQPPLYNLFLGIVLKLSPGAWVTETFALIYCMFGLLMGLCLYRLLALLGVPALVSFAATAVFLVMPATVLYENYLFYTYPTALLLTAATLAFARMIDGFTLARGLAFFSLLAALIYARSLFQHAWFLVLLGFAVWVQPGYRRQVLIAAAIPLLIVVMLYGKNSLVFGHFSTSSWLGMSLAKVSTMQLPEVERERMVAADALSPLALIAPFSGPDAYPRFIRRALHSGVPVLDRRRKSSGVVNYNHSAYIPIAGQYQDDALTVIRTHPEAYLNTMGQAWRMFFRPAADYPLLQGNRERIAPWVRIGNRYLAGQPRFREQPGFEFSGWGSVGYAALAGFVVCVMYGATRLWSACVRTGSASATTVTLAFIWLNIAYVSVVGNAFEIDENQRFRYLIDPLITAMLTVLAYRLFQALRRRRFQPLAESRR